MDSLSKIRKQIKHDPANLEFTKQGIDPLYAVHPAARICLIGQAPGVLAQESGIYFNDPSGVRLRQWLGLSDEDFYTPEKIAVLPMDFYYPGKGKSGDLPPRNNIWLKKNLWFEREVVPALQEMVAEILDK